jgi:pimeloyl-ACP methyl ester carboxylesterase
MMEIPAVGREKHTLLQDSRLPIWRELGACLEWLDLRRSPIYRGVGAPRGTGETVILVPGFLGSDNSLSELRRWLTRIGYRVAPSGIARNIDCPDVSLARLLEATESAAHISGERVRLIGHSLGGTLSRAAATRRPDLIAQVITLASPVREIIAHPLVAGMARFLQTYLPSPDDVPRRHGDHFHSGDCACDTLDALSQPFPNDVARTAIYTRSDGVLQWRTTLDHDPAVNMEVSGTHLGLIANREVYQALARLLSTNANKGITWQRAA